MKNTNICLSLALNPPLPPTTQIFIYHVMFSPYISNHHFCWWSCHECFSCSSFPWSWLILNDHQGHLSTTPHNAHGLYGTPASHHDPNYFTHSPWFSHGKHSFFISPLLLSSSGMFNTCCCKPTHWPPDQIPSTSESPPSCLLSVAPLPANQSSLVPPWHFKSKAHLSQKDQTHHLF